MLGEHLLEIGLIELLARDIGEYRPEAERKNGSALEALTGWKQQLPISLQRAHDLERIFASLLQRTALPHGGAMTRQQFDFCFVGRYYGLEAPVLHLKHEQAVRWVNDDKVRMPIARAYREIMPNDSVLFEEVLEALREPQLAARVEAREAQARDQYCHATPVDRQLTRASSGHTAAPALFTLTMSPSPTAFSPA